MESICKQCGNVIYTGDSFLCNYATCKICGEVIFVDLNESNTNK